MPQNKVKKMCIAGVFAAIIFITTAYLFHIPIGSSGGYIHFGDALIYLAACILPRPYAMAAGAIGAGLSDVLSPGGIVWLLPTIVIKSLIPLGFTSKTPGILNKRNFIALIPACILTTAGYYLASAIITGNFTSGLIEIPGALLQSAGSSAGFIVCGYALDHSRFSIKKLT